MTHSTTPTQEMTKGFTSAELLEMYSRAFPTLKVTSATETMHNRMLRNVKARTSGSLMVKINNELSGYAGFLTKEELAEAKAFLIKNLA